MFEPHQINVSAYRVLRILALFVEHQTLNLAELGMMLLDDPKINKPYSTETLTRYLSTLTQIGCRFDRIYENYQYRYRLLEHPFHLSFTPQMLEGATALLQGLQQHGTQVTKIQEQEAQQDPCELFQQVAAILALMCQKLDLTAELTPNMWAIKIPQGDTFLKIYHEYCREGQVLEIQFQCNPGSSFSAGIHSTQGQPKTSWTCLLEPYRVVEPDETRATPLLLGLDWMTREPLVIPLNTVLAVKQLSSRCRSSYAQSPNPDFMPRTVRFCLSGRLADRYRSHPGEWLTPVALNLLQKRTSTVPQILVHTPLPPMDALEPLLQRLMKYGELCTVLDPAYIRRRMALRVNAMAAGINKPAFLRGAL